MSPTTPQPGKALHWALAVLCLLRERDMHPYEMRRIIRQRHKEERLLLKAGSLYHGIHWLVEHHLIEKVNISRQGKRPERTTYRITSKGKEQMRAWLQQLLSGPVREPSSFAVALDHLIHLSPSGAADQLDKRLRHLEPRLEEMERTLQTLTPVIGRINVLELAYERELCRAEFDWVQKLTRDLREGKLVWDIEEILSYLRTHGGSAPERP